jgi:TolB-like protein
MHHAPDGPGRVRFGVFELDLRTGELRKRGVRIRLQEQPFQVLAMLLEKPRELVTREDLRQRLWTADTFVDFDHGLNKAINKIRGALGDGRHRPRSGVGRGWIMLARSSRSTTVRSLAVLPLDSLSSDPSQEYFADGMTDQLITTLGQISALRVISRTSVMPYKHTRKPLPQIAHELNVDAVVEGTVIRSGAQVRITAQLIDAAADKHLWAQSYDGDLRDTLALQNTVARAIAEQIRINVTPQEQVAFETRERRESGRLRGLSQGALFLEQENRGWFETGERLF